MGVGVIRLDCATFIVRRGDPLMFDSTSLFLSLITGGVGFVLMAYARKTHSWPFFVGGLLYMVYPYFVQGWIAFTGVGVAIGVALWIAVRQGW
jgi:hypothetical protein